MTVATDRHNQAATSGTRRPLLLVIATYAALLLLIVNATDADAVLGVVLRVPALRFVSLTIAGLLLAFLLLHHRSVMHLLSIRLVSAWVFLLAPAPVIVLLIQFSVGLYDRDTAIYWSAIFLTTGINFTAAVLLSAMRHSDRYVRIFVIGTATISIAGFILQSVDYPTLREIMWYSSNVIANSTRLTRLIGFFSHPNYAAISVIVLSIPLLTAGAGKLDWSLRSVITISTLYFLVLSTGSRTSLLLLSLMALVYLWRTISNGLSMSTLTRNVLLMVSAGVVASAILTFVLPVTTSSDDSLGLGLQRVAQLLSSLDVAGEADASASLRAAIIGPYFELSFNSPLIGYGHQWLGRQIGTIDLPIVSQNSWIQWTVEYGYPYVLAMALVYFATFRMALVRMRNARTLSTANAAFGLFCFFVVVTLATFSINDIWLIKSVLIVFGVLLGRTIRSQAAEATEPVRESTHYLNKFGAAR